MQPTTPCLESPRFESAVLALAAYREEQQTEVVAVEQQQRPEDRPSDIPMTPRFESAVRALAATPRFESAARALAAYHQLEQEAIEEAIAGVVEEVAVVEEKEEEEEMAKGPSHPVEQLAEQPAQQAERSKRVEQAAPGSPAPDAHHGLSDSVCALDDLALPPWVAEAQKELSALPHTPRLQVMSMHPLSLSQPPISTATFPPHAVMD